jgi:hypothetical protein
MTTTKYHVRKLSLEQQHRNVEQMSKIREFERDIEQFEDELDTMRNVDNPTRKRRLQDRILNLRQKIQCLEKE